MLKMLWNVGICNIVTENENVAKMKLLMRFQSKDFLGKYVAHHARIHDYALQYHLQINSYTLFRSINFKPFTSRCYNWQTNSGMVHRNHCNGILIKNIPYNLKIPKILLDAYIYAYIWPWITSIHQSTFLPCRLVLMRNCCLNLLFYFCFIRLSFKNCTVHLNYRLANNRTDSESFF